MKGGGLIVLFLVGVMVVLATSGKPVVQNWRAEHVWPYADVPGLRCFIPVSEYDYQQQSAMTIDECGRMSGGGYPFELPTCPRGETSMPDGSPCDVQPENESLRDELCTNRYEYYYYPSKEQARQVAMNFGFAYNEIHNHQGTIKIFMGYEDGIPAWMNKSNGEDYWMPGLSHDIFEQHFAKICQR